MKRAVLTLVMLMGLVLIGASWPSSNKVGAMAQKAEGVSGGTCTALSELIVADPRSARATRAFQPLTVTNPECTTCCDTIKEEYVQCRWQRGGTACLCATKAFQNCRDNCGPCQCCMTFWDIGEANC